MLRKIKIYLDWDVTRVKRNIELASEESDAPRSRASSIDLQSRASSMESQHDRPNLIALPFHPKQTVEVVKEHTIKESIDATSGSSADEADVEENIQVNTLH